MSEKSKSVQEGAQQEVLFRFTAVPSMAYVSRPAITYYVLDQTPVAVFAELTIEVRGSRASGVQQLRHHSVGKEQDVTEVYLPLNVPQGSAFLEGKLYFFGFDRNPDPEESEKLVVRIAVLGLTHDNQFGFFRVIDTFNGGLPGVDSFQTRSPLFQIWSCPVAFAQPSPSKQYGPFYFKDLVVEAGSPSALAISSSR